MLLSATLFARVDAATNATQNYLGLQGFALVGDHRDIAGEQHGLGGGVFLEARVGGPRVGFHFEGFPVVSVPQRSSAFYGAATPAVGIVDAAFRYTLDAGGRFTVGLGGVVINQRTPLPNISQVVSSRLTGVWAELVARMPARGSRFYEANLSFAPHLTGTDHFLYSDGSPAVNKPERASVVSASLGFGTRVRSNELVVGLRAVNFSAQFTQTGESADSNAGVGPFLEWRFGRAPAGAQ
ncbi:MAG TPA: hypothetical protein VIJ12_08645 [Candidatus Baltobacteraceae bacterium]